MKSQPPGIGGTQRFASSHGQPRLFDGYEDGGHDAVSCEVVAVGKRRDGGTRYWCLSHRADATAKYGRRAAVCRGAHIPVISERETLGLHLDSYSGGVALWGAVPPVYDTTVQPLDRGIHVHARKTLGSEKILDDTFRAVRIFAPAFAE